LTVTLYYGPPRGHLRLVMKRLPSERKYRTVLEKLRAFLKAEEPVVVRWLVTLWDQQQAAVTYKEIRDDILNGSFTIDKLQAWQQDYSRFVAEKLAPKWQQAMEEAAKAHVDNSADIFDPFSQAVQAWIEQHGSELAVNLTQVQHEALKAVILQAAVAGKYGPDELARVIRPMVGLTPSQARGCLRYYEALRQDGAGPKKALEGALRYAANAHRYRAQNIARTELAFAFNQGAHMTIQHAQAQGYMGEVKKKWVTADDERVCELCGPLDGVTVDQDENFPGAGSVPPRHPSCRCVVVYQEVDEHGRTR
jgi:SPP1 gp7 family putative phage head morphogenesis protein